MSDTRELAQTSVLATIQYLINIGYEVAIPFDHSSPTDLIARRVYEDAENYRGTWYNIQVKSFYETKTGWVANVMRTTPTGRRAYTPDEVDFFALVMPGEEPMLVTRKWVGSRTRIAESTARGLDGRGVLCRTSKQWTLPFAT